MCAACKLGEICVSQNGITWKCEKPDHPALPEPVLRCGESVMEVGLQVAKLQAIGLDAFSAHLSDPRCHDHAEINSTVWYRVERTEATCGNTLKTNGTHALYSNSLFVYPVLNVSFVQPLSVPFTCAYPLDGHSSLNIAVRPYLPVDNAAVGMGTAVRATMSLFQNANYTDPYPAGPITKDVGSVLYVGVSIDEPESKRFVVVLEECYASHSSSPEDLMRYYLIQRRCVVILFCINNHGSMCIGIYYHFGCWFVCNLINICCSYLISISSPRCPTEERFVKLNESGSSLQARFSALLFLYQGDYQDVFLHCSLSLCDQRSSSCSPVSAT
ncbi:uromodulin-like [Aplochiton taeniatus]